MNIPAPKKILIVRTDRIGDVVLSLPMIPLLKSRLPQSSITFLLRSYTQDLMKGQNDLESILLYDNRGIEKHFSEMLQEIKQHGFNAVIVTYPTFRLAMLMFLARIPVRVGTGYRWYSFLFNTRIYEHRKTAEKHEAEYNVSLLGPLGVKRGENILPRLELGENDRSEARETLRQMGIEEDRPFVVLHPGSGGSARDWPPERFGQLAAKLEDEGLCVVVTKGPSEDHLVQSILMHSGPKAKVIPRSLPLMVLAALIEKAQVFVANSTGPLHIAAAVGTPVVAFYPPIRQCSSTRWGPLSQRKVIFEPDSKSCPLCRGGTCQSNECLKTISADEVAGAVLNLMSVPSRLGATAG